MIKITVENRLRSQLVKGHPWVYANQLRTSLTVATGSLVALYDDQGFVAWAIADPGQTIAARIWSLAPTPPSELQALTERIDTAYTWRNRLRPPTVEAYRLLHGEADHTPGWTLDVYRDVWVVRTDGPAAVTRLPLLCEVIDRKQHTWAIRAIVHRRSRRDQSGPAAELIWGSLPPESFACQEYSWQMEVDVLQGQKTGWFLDQRENRKFIYEFSAKKDILNLFSYTGGFSLAAALGGANSVVSVDISAQATAAAQRNFMLNGLAEQEYEFITADAFDWLPLAAQQDSTFDMIIIDPPSFAPNAKSVATALRAYQKLYRFALTLLRPHGFLIAASCSSHITATMLTEQVVIAAAKQARQIQKIIDRGPGWDHPTLPNFPEGNYLKFLGFHVS